MTYPQKFNYLLGMLEISNGRGTLIPISKPTKGDEYYSDITIMSYDDRVVLTAKKHTFIYHYDNNQDRRFNFDITKISNYENKFILSPEDYYKPNWFMRVFYCLPKRALKKGWYELSTHEVCEYIFLDKALLIKEECNDNKTR